MQVVQNAAVSETDYGPPLIVPLTIREGTIPSAMRTSGFPRSNPQLRV